MRADLLEFGAREIAVVSGKNMFKTATNTVGRQTLTRQLGSENKKKPASPVNPKKFSKQNSRFYKQLSLSMTKFFQYQLVVAVSGNHGAEVPVVDNVLSSHDQNVYPTFQKLRKYLTFKLQVERRYYVGSRQTFLALKKKFVEGHG